MSNPLSNKDQGFKAVNREAKVPSPEEVAQGKLLGFQEFTSGLATGQATPEGLAELGRNVGSFFTEGSAGRKKVEGLLASAQGRLTNIQARRQRPGLAGSILSSRNVLLRG